MTTRGELVEGGLDLVHSLARYYASHNAAASLEDLVGEGYVGLIQAARSYRAARGTKFVTFAKPRVRGAIIDCLRRERPLSRPMAERVRAFTSARSQVSERIEGEPGDSEVGQLLCLTTAKLKEVQRMRALKVTSLESHLETSRHDVADDSDSPEDLAIASLTRSEIRTCVARLRPRDREIIWRIYWEGQRHRDVGSALGISASRVSQIQTQALRRLRRMMECERGIQAA